MIDLDGVQTVGDVIDKINSHVDNFVGPLVTAGLSTTGNGLVLSAPTGAQQLQIINSGGSQAAPASAWCRTVPLARPARRWGRIV